ncbi:MAG: cupin domain-containing protein [Gammaproteobacteria bacterium]
MISQRVTKKHLMYLLLAAIILFFISVQTLSAEQKSSLRKELLFEKTVELPAKEVDAKIVRVTFPPGFKTPWHEHQGPGPRYIITGQLKVTEGGVTKNYSAGDVFWESGLRMKVENVGEDAAELIIFELAPTN